MGDPDPCPRATGQAGDKGALSVRCVNKLSHCQVRAPSAGYEYRPVGRSWARIGGSGCTDQLAAAWCTGRVPSASASHTSAPRSISHRAHDSSPHSSACRTKKVTVQLQSRATAHPPHSFEAQPRLRRRPTRRFTLPPSTLSRPLSCGAVTPQASGSESAVPLSQPAV